MTQYRQELRVFNRLKSDCSNEARKEYEQAISILQQRYNTTIYENRFIVGGAVEMFTHALLRSVGIDCTLYADQSKSGDILLPNDRKLSVKSAFTGGAASIKLMNKMGSGDRVWETATLFVLANVGIVFGAHDMVPEDSVKDVRDGLELRKRAVEFLMKDPANIFSCIVPKKQPTETTGHSQKASTTIARSILVESNLVELHNALGKQK